MSVDGPGGTVTLDGPSHHVIQNINIGVANGNKGFKVVSTEKDVPPSFEQNKCDLVKNPDTNKQFTP